MRLEDIIIVKIPGARKEEQIQTEFEVAQVRDRDDTLRRGYRSIPT